MVSPMSTRTFIAYSTDPTDWPSMPDTQLNNGDKLLVIDTANNNALSVYFYDEEAVQWRGV